MYRLYSTICLRKWLTMGVSCQIIKIVAYVNEQEVPAAVSIFWSNTHSIQWQSTLLLSQTNLASRRYLGCSTCDLLACSSVNHYRAFIPSPTLIEGYSPAASAEVRRSSHSGKIGIVSSRRINLSESCSTCGWSDRVDSEENERLGL